MGLAAVAIAVAILIGIVMCVLAVLGALYWGLLLPFAVFLFIGGIIVIVFTILLYFYLI